MAHYAEHLIQVGMRAVARDVLDYVATNRDHGSLHVEADELSAYLLTLMAAAGGGDDVQG